MVSFRFGTSAATAVPIDVNYHEGTGFWWTDPSWFQITLGSTLGGWIDANAGDTGIGMRSTDGLWTIGDFYADRGDPCEGTAAMWCQGVTGQWIAEQVAAVPLPGTLALLGAGFLAAVARRRPIN